MAAATEMPAVAAAAVAVAAAAAAAATVGMQLQRHFPRVKFSLCAISTAVAASAVVSCLGCWLSSW